MNSLLTKNIWAVGRNYAEHTKEMQDSIPDKNLNEPFFFLKAGTCIKTGSKVTLPKWSIDVQHEIEIALRIDENLNFSHISLALDLTARDTQRLAKSRGLPWTLAKSFAGACPISEWLSLETSHPFENLTFELTKNNVLVQKGCASDMIFKPQQLLEYVKMHFPLAPQDIILTGTPKGVSALKSGDHLQATLQKDKLKILTCHWDVV